MKNKKYNKKYIKYILITLHRRENRGNKLIKCGTI